MLAMAAANLSHAISCNYMKLVQICIVSIYNDCTHWIHGCSIVNATDCRNHCTDGRGCIPLYVNSTLLLQVLMAHPECLFLAVVQSTYLAQPQSLPLRPVSTGQRWLLMRPRLQQVTTESWRTVQWCQPTRHCITFQQLVLATCLSSTRTNLTADAMSATTTRMASCLKKLESQFWVIVTINRKTLNNNIIISNVIYNIRLYPQKRRDIPVQKEFADYHAVSRRMVERRNNRSNCFSHLCIGCSIMIAPPSTAKTSKTLAKLVLYYNSLNKVTLLCKVSDWCVLLNLKKYKLLTDLLRFVSHVLWRAWWRTRWRAWAIDIFCTVLLTLWFLSLNKWKQQKQRFVAEVFRTTMKNFE